MAYRIVLRLPNEAAIRGLLWWIGVFNRQKDPSEHATIEVAGREPTKLNRREDWPMFWFGVAVGIVIVLAVEHWQVVIEGIGSLITKLRGH